MNTMASREKPDLLFNNPQKQKAYLFLKNNPGRDFETFQILTGEATVSKQHFIEVEQAIRAREDRENAKGAVKEANSLFLSGTLSEKAPKPFGGFSTTKKEPTLKKIEKKKQNSRAKEFIKQKPGCTYEELVEALGFEELSKPHFFSMKTQLRKKGLIPGESRTRRTHLDEVGSSSRLSTRTGTSGSWGDKSSSSSLSSKTIEIVASVDATGFSDELRENYKSHFLPLLQKLWPGQGLQMVFITDPPSIEIRRAPR